MKRKYNTEWRPEMKTDLPDAFKASEYETSSYYSHFHALIEIYGPVNGEVVCSVGAETITLKPGQYIAVNPLVIHSYTVEKPVKIRYLHIGKKYLCDFEALYKGKNLAVFLDDVQYNKRITKAIKRVVAEGNQMSALEKHGVADLLLNDIIKHYGFSESVSEKITEQAKSNKYKSDLLIEILHFIYDHYNEQVTLQTLSEKFGVSPVVLSRIFSAHVGVDLRILLGNIRVQAYYNMRRDPQYKDYTNINLAYKCGFSSPQTFLRAYNRNFGKYTANEE